LTRDILIEWGCWYSVDCFILELGLLDLSRVAKVLERGRRCEEGYVLRWWCLDGLRGIEVYVFILFDRTIEDIVAFGLCV